MSVQPEILEEDLPGSVADIAQAIGVPATLKLIERFGGSRVYVPEWERITEDHAIARAIGLAAACAVAKLCAKNRLEMPRAASAFRRARDRAIREDSRSASVSNLAFKYRLSERRVYQIRSLPARASQGRDKQPSLMPDLRAGFLAFLKRYKLAVHEWALKCPAAKACRAAGCDRS